MQYAKALKRAQGKALSAVGLSRAELEECIAAIGKALISPLLGGDAERIMLCADRASLRKALAALPD